jgi:DNA-binding LacI/PurR family transcriptional regulator
MKPTRGKRRGRPPGTNTRYREIAADIARRIGAKEWALGRRIPSIEQFSRGYAVGIKTIHLAMKVLAAEGRVSMRPNRPTLAAAGRPLLRVFENSLAVVMNHGIARVCQPGMNQSMWHGIAANADRIGLTILLLTDDRLWKKEFPSGLGDLPFRGFLITGPFPSLLLRQYETLSAPVVLLDQPGKDFKLHSVSVANFDSAYDATRRLIELGHRRLAFIRSVVTSLQDIDPDSRERQAGFLAACKRAGLKGEAARVVTAAHHPSSPTIRELVRSKPGVTAMLLATTGHVDHVERECTAAGLNIPRDLSVATFQSHEPLSRDWSGPRIPFEKFGPIGIDLLLRKPKRFEHIQVPTVWNAGETIGRAKQRMQR